MPGERKMEDLSCCHSNGEAERKKKGTSVFVVDGHVARSGDASSFLPRPVTTKWLQRHKRRQEPSEHFMVGNTNGHPIHPDDLALTCFRVLGYS